MEPPFEVNSEAIEELPEELRQPLLSFLASRSEKDLNAVIRSALSDFADTEIPDDLSDDANFIEDLGLDSLTITEFVFFFEDIFGLKITNDDLARMRTLRELKQFLSARLVG